MGNTTATKAAMIELITKEAKITSIDPKLIYGFVSTESTFDPKAVKYEPTYIWLESPPLYARQSGISTDTEIVLQKISWGLMQLMGANSRTYGLVGSLFQMLDPAVGLHYACIHLAKLLKKYTSLDDVIAAYNKGSPIKKDDGTYVNQAYVDKVKLAMQNAPDSVIGG